MKRIGLLGGMSWQSTVPYYQVINETVAARLGGLHSAEILLYSVDFGPLEKLQHAGRWSELGEVLAGAARTLEAAGAELLVLCTNTMHKVAPQVEAAIEVPLLHIADATAEQIAAAGLRRVGLLGTRFTMEEDFYRARLEAQHGLDVRVPPAADRETVHRVIFDELCLGQQRDDSRDAYRRIAADLVAEGCEAVILGCTEIGFLLQPGDATVPLYDTARIHAEKVASVALS